MIFEIHTEIAGDVSTKLIHFASASILYAPTCWCIDRDDHRNDAFLYSAEHARGLIITDQLHTANLVVIDHRVISALALRPHSYTQGYQDGHSHFAADHDQLLRAKRSTGVKVSEPISTPVSDLPAPSRAAACKQDPFQHLPGLKAP